MGAAIGGGTGKNAFALSASPRTKLNAGYARAMTLVNAPTDVQPRAGLT